MQENMNNTQEGENLICAISCVSRKGGRGKKVRNVWTYLTIGLVSVSAAAAMLLVVGSALLAFQTDTKAIIEHCRYNQLSTSLPCHQLRLFRRIMPRADPNCFLRASLLTTIILGSHFIVASLILLLVGILRRKYWAFFPFLCVELLIAIILSLGAALDLQVDGKTGSISVSSWFLPILIFINVQALTWFVATVTCMQMKKLEEDSKNYIRLEH